MQIREATKQDVPHVINLITQVYKEYECTLLTQEEPYLLKFDTCFKEAGGNSWVLESGEKVIGSVALRVLESNTGELKSLYLDGNYRGRRLGFTLVNFVLDKARILNLSRLILWTDTRFTSAHDLYRKMGFEVRGFRIVQDSNNSSEYKFEYNLLDTASIT